MYQEQKLYIGKSGEEKVCIYPKMANRHGLIAGATGTGKTVSLRVLAESFSDCGVSVFLADAKGDLASMSLREPAKEVSADVWKSWDLKRKDLPIMLIR